MALELGVEGWELSEEGWYVGSDEVEVVQDVVEEGDGSEVFAGGGVWEIEDQETVCGDTEDGRLNFVLEQGGLGWDVAVGEVEGEGREAVDEVVAEVVLRHFAFS